VVFQVSGEPQRYEPIVEEQLLRIGQEAISNAVQHANAKTINVELHCTGTGVTLKVTDDGVGFEPDNAKVKHWGLVSMRERAEQIGATLRLVSSNRGTQVEASVATAAVAPQ
jgi:NarL family two-component system sensor histidine kinase LiaS